MSSYFTDPKVEVTCQCDLGNRICCPYMSIAFYIMVIISRKLFLGVKILSICTYTVCCKEKIHSGNTGTGQNLNLDHPKESSIT